ncbi:MAG: hypothetical protein LH478_03610, partial [Chitinophagaceae bacterium]|nr:hypothetical protein [Chitinophagaceae bacterium]
MKKIIGLILILISIGIAIIYFVSCLTPFISQAQFWPLSFLSLGFVFIVFAMVVATIYWFFRDVKIGVVFLLLFLFGYRNLTALYALNFSKFKQPKKQSDLRILHWNVRHFVENGKMYDWPYAVRRKMFDYIRQMDPDVLLMQEFLEINSIYYYSNIKLFDSIGYIYYYLRKDDFQVIGDMSST